MRLGLVVFEKIIPDNSCSIFGHNFQRPTILVFEFVDIHLERHPFLNDTVRGAWYN